MSVEREVVSAWRTERNAVRAEWDGVVGRAPVGGGIGRVVVRSEIAGVRIKEKYSVIRDCT